MLFGVFSILSIDPSGSALEFNRFLDLVKLFKLFGFWFDTNLTNFIDNLSGYNTEKQAPSKRRILAVGSNTKKAALSRYHRYKFEKYEVNLSLTGIFLFKTISYALFWAIKIIRILYFNYLKQDPERRLRASWQAHLIVYSRKIHFIGFGVVLMDLTFNSVRILLHRVNDSKSIVIKLICLTNIFLLTLDFIEIFLVAYGMKYTKPSSKVSSLLSQIQKINNFCRMEKN